MVAAGAGTWWVWVLILIALAGLAVVMITRRRQLEHVERGWRSRAEELYTRGVTLHDRLASSDVLHAPMAPGDADRLADAEWMVDDLEVAVAGLGIGAPDEASRAASHNLATSLGSVKEAVRLRAKVPDSADTGTIVDARLHDLQESLTRFRSVVRNGRAPQSTSGEGNP